MGFTWTEWALKGLSGIEPHEVNQVFGGERCRPIPGVSDDTGVQVMTFWGRTRAGRALIVAARQVDRWDWMIIGARDMTGEEITEFERWESQ